MDALRWAILLWCTAAVGFLIARPLFRCWPDQGYGVAKVTGPLLAGAIAWCLAGLDVLTWGRDTSIAACLVLGIAAALVARRSSFPLPAGSILWRIDAVWLLCGAAFLLLRATHPSIIGAERPMDHALLAALMRQHTIPPIDPWFAGAAVNYHYVGYAMWAALAHVVLPSPAVAYNLVLATLPAQTVAVTWSVGRRLSTTTNGRAHRAWWGAAAVVAGAPVAALASLGATWASPRSLSVARAMPGTVTEFPFFSFVWGDLHGHVLALPLLLALVAIVVRLDEFTHGHARTPRTLIVGTTLLAATLATASVLTSTWDVLPAGLAAAWTLLLLSRLPRSTVLIAVASGAGVALLIATPVLLSFRPPAVPAGWEWSGSDAGSFLLVQSAWLLPTGLILLHRTRASFLVGAVALVMLCGWMVPGTGVRAGLLALSIGLWMERGHVGRPTTAMLLSALALLFVAECLWVDDIYGWQLRRMNTVFKWHLHAIVLMACALPGVFATLLEAPGRLPRRVTLSAATLLALVSCVHVTATVASHARHREPVFTIDGLSGMNREHPGDAAAVRYLWTHASGTDVVLEAAGRSYSYGSRISAMTGQPTLLGWRGHETLWRRGEDWARRIDARARLVDDLYAGAMDGLGERLRSAGVRYVVVGPVERRTYPSLTAARFDAHGRVVVSERGTVLLRVD